MTIKTIDEILTWIDEEIVFASESLKLSLERGDLEKFNNGFARGSLSSMLELKEFILEIE